MNSRIRRPLYISFKSWLCCCSLPSVAPQQKERLVVIYTNDCKISRLWGAASSLTFNKSLSNLAVLLISRPSFKRCRWIFLNLFMSKVERKKTVKMSIFYLNFCSVLELSLVWKLPVASSLTRGLSLIKSSTVKCIGVAVSYTHLTLPTNREV